VKLLGSGAGPERYGTNVLRDSASPIRPIFLTLIRLPCSYKRPFSMGSFFWQALIGSRAPSAGVRAPVHG
jgi:hypothetical protein